MALPRLLTGAVGQATRTIGRTIDYATPGAGTNRFTEKGRNISNVQTDIRGKVLRSPTGIPYKSGAPLYLSTGQWADPALRTAGTSQATTQQTQTQAAARQAAAVQDAMRSRLLDQKGVIFSSARDAASTGGRKLNNSILDLVDQLRVGQQGVDNKGIQNELARKQGQSDILAMINRGITSGGSVLRNANASSSSAAQALAQAYADMGRRQLSGINQQYELGNREVGEAQANLDMQRASGVRDIQSSKQDIVDNIVQSANEGLAQLDAQLIDASLPERIAIEQEKAAIRQEVLNQLAQYDELLSSRTGEIRAMDADQRRAQAFQLANSGTAAENAFDYSTAAPAEFQGTGPFAGDLPIFTYRRRQAEY